MKHLKDEELLREAQLVHELTESERNKLNKNKAYIQQKKDEQYANWQKNQLIKNSRITQEKNIEAFLTTKIKGNIENSNEKDHDFHKESMDYFQLNCQKLGVEMKHDPEKKNKGKFLRKKQRKIVKYSRKSQI